ncbi:DUF1444 family protein [Viridibacterium curvum]|uniref:Uncharacterized protein n=1 Tax=Viridibacterium curvum TaxID=1101404 RepID=A0ABP9R8J5_9RHOO
MGKAILGLQNLLAKICQANPPLSKSVRQQEMRTHFQAVMQSLKVREAKAPHEWKEAKEALFPQLMPSDYLKLLKEKALITRSFVAGVELAVVVDTKDGYGYVRDEDRARWKVSENELFDAALKNLNEKKGGTKLQGGGDPERFLAFEEGDGYDAVRVLLPWVRQEAAKFLGDPFFAIVPNRDFLIMWSTKNSAKFQNFAKTRGAEDFKSQPYPLSPLTLRVWANGKIEVAP